MHALLRVIALVVFGPIAIAAGMALLSVVTDNIWIQLGVSVLVLLGVPLFVADRLLPDDEEAMKKSAGLPLDILSLSWGIVAFVFAGLLGSSMGDMWRAEAETFASSPLAFAAPVLRWFGGPAPVATPEPDVETPTPDTGTSSAADAGEDAGETDAGADTGEDAGAEEPEADTSQALSPAELFRRWAPSVVAVQMRSGPMQGGGTGFFVSRDLILTNHHVVAPALREGASMRIRVKTFDRRWARQVFLVDKDEERDLALLRVVLDGRPKVTRFGDSEEVQPGQQAISIGNPLGLEHTLTEGLVSARRVYEGKRYIQTSAPVSPGNSGGPLFNDHGAVIGVTVAQVGAGWARAQNLNLAIPANDASEFVRRRHEDDEQRIGGGEPETEQGSW